MWVLISVFVVSVKRQVEPERGAEFPPRVRRSAAGGSDGGHFLTVFADFVAVASVISATNLDIRIAHCELVGFTDGVRESAQSWRDPLLDLKCRGLIQGRSRARRRREGYRPQRPRYGQQPAGFTIPTAISI